MKLERGAGQGIVTPRPMHECRGTLAVRMLGCALVLAVLCIGRARASGLSTSPVQVNTFGTLGAVYQDSPGLAFRRTIGQGHGARAGSIDLGTDSLFGLQLSGHTDFGLDAQVQGIVQRNSEGRWRPKLARAFLRYEPDPSLMLRAGRIGLSLYLLGDALDVGYSYLTVRPPPEVYGILANAEFNGADLTYSRPLGTGVVRLRVLGGQMPFDFATAQGRVLTFSDDDLIGATADYLDNSWESRIAVVRVSVHTAAPFVPLASGLEASGVPQASSLAAQLVRTPQNTYAFEAGTSYSGEHLRATVVLVRLDSQDVIGPRQNSGYVLLGWRFGHITPFAVFSMAKSFARVRSTGLPAVPAFAPLIAGAYQAQTAFQTTQRDFSFGARYDFAPHMDVKVQLDRIWLQHSALIFDYHQPPLSHASMTVASVALDFAF